jgi:DNA gyrase/topoisomerase IV subunit A
MTSEKQRSENTYLLGLKKALDFIDKVISITIRASKRFTKLQKLALIKEFKFSDLQATSNP